MYIVLVRARQKNITNRGWGDSNIYIHTHTHTYIYIYMREVIDRQIDR